MIWSMIPWRLVAAGLALAAAAAFGATLMHKHDQKRYDALQARYETFVDKTMAEGAKAKKDAADKDAVYLKRKEEADAQNSAALATLAGTIKRLRDARSGSGFVPQAAACPGSPERAGFDRAELERALRTFDQEVQGLVDEGSRAVVDLDTAKKWAQSIPAVSPPTGR